MKRESLEQAAEIVDEWFLKNRGERLPDFVISCMIKGWDDKMGVEIICPPNFRPVMGTVPPGKMPDGHVVIIKIGGDYQKEISQLINSQIRQQIGDAWPLFKKEAGR